MATAVQGKVPAHKGPVNHEVESDDDVDVDEDDVRSLPALLLFHDARNARRGKGVPRNPHRSPIRSSRVFLARNPRLARLPSRVLSETFRSRKCYGTQPGSSEWGIRLVLFLTHAPASDAR